MATLNAWKDEDRPIIRELEQATIKTMIDGFRPINTKCYLSCWKVAQELSDEVLFIEGNVIVPEELKEYFKELDQYYHWIMEYKGVWWDAHCSMVFREATDPLPMEIINTLNTDDFMFRLKSNEIKYGKEAVWGGSPIKKQLRRSFNKNKSNE